MVEAHLVPSIALTYQPPLREKLFLLAGQFFLEYQWSPDHKAGYSGVKGSQGTLGCTPNNVPMVFIVFSRESYGF